MNSLQAGGKFRVTTIAELGKRKRPIDMFVYQQVCKDFLLMSNTSRGFMKIPTNLLATAAPITAPVTTPTGGSADATVASMRGIEQMDLLDAQNSIVLARTQAGINLQVVPLP